MRHILINHQLVGDGLISSPAIRTFKKTLPEDDQLVMITGPEEYQSMWKNNPYIDSVIPTTHEKIEAIKVKWGTELLEQGKVLEKCFWQWQDYSSKAGGKDRGCIFDTGIAFSYVNNTPRALNAPVPHLAEGFAKMLGVKLDSTKYDLVLTEEEIAWGTQFVNNKYREKPVIVCGAVSKSCTSRSTKPHEQGWPANKMLSAEVWNEVIEELRHDFNFVFVSAKGEERLDVNAYWEDELTIRQTAAFIKASATFCGIDSGPGHVAAAVDANIVSICAAVPETMVSVQHTNGKHFTIDHYPGNPAGNPTGIFTVTSNEIIEAIRKVTA